MGYPKQVVSINHQRQIPSTRIGSAGGFCRRCRDRFGAGIAEGKEDGFGAFRLVALKFFHGTAEGAHPEILGTVRALHAIDKRGEIDQFAARVHEIEIERLLLRHSMGEHSGRIRG